MEYQGYMAQVEFDDDAKLFHGRVVGLRDVITFQAERAEDLKHEFTVSIDEYLKWCAQRGEAPEVALL
jgi:predicted HicB family RNase H-like nuclease